jgi:hypothetical protein
MTAGLKLPPMLTVDDRTAGDAIAIFIVGRIWRLVMLVILLIPERLFKRTRI